MKISAAKLQSIQHLLEQGIGALNRHLYDIAEQHFSKVLSIAPAHPPALAYLAFTFSTQKKHHEAIQVLLMLLKTQQNMAQTHFNLGAEYFACQDFANATQHYRACLKLHPKLVDGWIDLAICLRLSKKEDEAISCLQNALNIDPKNAKAFQVLGLCYFQKEDFSRALECLHNATGLQPDIPDYHISFAQALTNVGFFIDAEREWRTACELNPNQVDSFIGFGEMLSNIKAHEEALECFERAKLLKPTSGRVLNNLGKCYAGLANLEQSLAFYEQSIATGDEIITAYKGKADVLLEHGKTTAADEIANLLIEQYPDEPAGYVCKANSTKSTSGDGIAESLEKFAALDKYKNDALLHFTIGKVYDDRKNYNAAFKNYATGNQLRDLSLSFNQSEDKQRFDALIELFDASFIKKHADIGNHSDFPVFIVGMPRSGTTLTEQIISSHPQVMAAGEVAYWDKLETNLPMFLDTQTPFPMCITELSHQKSQELVDSYLSQLHKICHVNQSIKHVTDKMPHNFMQIGLIHLVFPNAKIIHIKRHPIDTCLSIFFQHFNDYHSYSFNLDNLGFHYRQYERLMAHWHQVLPGRIMDIEYENIIADPEYWSRQLIQHIGLEWDDACLAPHKLERSVKTASVWQVRQPIYKSSVERWRHYEPYLTPLLKSLNLYHE